MTDEFTELLKEFETEPKNDFPQEEKVPILVVDDDESIRRGLRSVFSHRYDVLTSECGKDAVETLSDAVHCVILDVKMKEFNGFYTYPKLKAKSPNVPIIFYTAFQSEHDLQEVINKYKPEGYVDKGRDISFLDNLVANAVTKYRLILENEEYKHDLEKKVEERTADLNNALADLKAAQAQIIQQGTMASVGRLAVGIAHNLRNPIEAAHRSLQEIRTVIPKLLGMNEYFEQCGISSEDGQKLKKFLDTKYLKEAKLAFFDTREINQRAQDLRDTLATERLTLNKQISRKLAEINIDSSDLVDLQNSLSKYDASIILSILEVGYSAGIHALSASRGMDEAAMLVDSTMSYVGRKGSSKGPSNLNEAVLDVLTLMSGSLKKNSIQVTKDLAEPPPFVSLERNRINQIIENLISNAINAMEDNDQDRKIDIQTLEKDGSVFFEIRDTGTGIPKDIQEKIFQPFFTTRDEGTGLGLYTVYQTLKGRGTVSVESEPGCTIFRIRFASIRPNWKPLE